MTSRSGPYFSIAFLWAGAYLAWRIGHLTEPEVIPSIRQRLVSRVPIPSDILLTALMCFAFFIQYSPIPIISSHPIDSLIRDATVQSEAWAKQASASQTLDQALVEYRRRYKRYPPPAFNDWYAFAKEKSSFVIDDWDQIYNDLEPFWVRPFSYFGPLLYGTAECSPCKNNANGGLPHSL